MNASIKTTQQATLPGVAPIVEAEAPVSGLLNITTEFLFAGRAVFTADNGATGDRKAHFTFKVRKWTPKDKAGQDQRPVFLTYLLTGPDRTRDWAYLGTVRLVAGFVGYYHSPKSKVSVEARSVAALHWVIRVLNGANRVPPAASIQHDGVCARCGRQLTHPESLKTGLGPDCYDIVMEGGK